MESWVYDDNIFISRRLGSPEGVVQVYRCWSLETPLADQSFSLIGEAAGPSIIAPALVWEQNDYLRLAVFLEVNAVMVNIRGHAIVSSEVKSRQAGRPDGPTTYWRCLDLLPLHAFGFVNKPVVIGNVPKFLIIGGDVNPTKATVEGDSQEWKTKVDDLIAINAELLARIKAIQVELDTSKEELRESRNENKKLASEVNDWKTVSNEFLDRIGDDQGELDTVKEGLREQTETLTKSQNENKKLASDLKSANEKLQVEGHEAVKLKSQVSKLRERVKNSVSQSVLDDSLEKVIDKWALKLAQSVLDLGRYRKGTFKPNERFSTLENLEDRDANYVETARMCGTVGEGLWDVYRFNDGRVNLVFNKPAEEHSDWIMQNQCFSHEGGDKRLFARIWVMWG